MERKNFKLILLVFLLLIVLALNVYIYYKEKEILEIREIYASVIVSDRLGFDVNSTALTFGMVIPGSASTRGLMIENKRNFPIIVEIYGKGEMKNFISFIRERLDSGEKREIKVTATALENAKPGNYSGKVIIVVKKAPA